MYRMRFVGLFAFALISACGEQSIAFSEISGVNQIVVLRGPDTLRSISDSSQIASVVEFVNSRATGWTRPWDGIPVPRIRAVLHRRSGARSFFGQGSGFFTTDLPGASATRPASREELDTFTRLLGLPADAAAR